MGRIRLYSVLITECGMRHVSLIRPTEPLCHSPDEVSCVYRVRSPRAGDASELSLTQTGNHMSVLSTVPGAYTYTHFFLFSD